MSFVLFEIKFSKLESRVLLLMLRGYSDMEISEKLTLSERNLRISKERIRRKTKKRSFLKNSLKMFNPFIYS